MVKSLVNFLELSTVFFAHKPDLSLKFIFQLSQVRLKSIPERYQSIM